MSNILLNGLRKIKLYIKTLEGLIISFINKRINYNFECARDTTRCCDNRKSPSFRYHNIGRNIPSCCATHLVNILNDVSMTLDKHNAQYFISFGTLLGSVRHSGIIPWDTDIDIIIAKNDEEKIYKILLEELNEEYHIKAEKDKYLVGGRLIRVYFSQQNSLHVDLFSYTETDTNISFYHNNTFKKENIFPLKKTNFYNLKLFAPNDIKGHLLSLYGRDYMSYAYKQWAANKKKFKIKNFKPAKIMKIK